MALAAIQAFGIQQGMAEVMTQVPDHVARLVRGKPDRDVQESLRAMQCSRYGRQPKRGWRHTSAAGWRMRGVREEMGEPWAGGWGVGVGGGVGADGRGYAAPVGAWAGPSGSKTSLHFTGIAPTESSTLSARE